MRTRSLFLPLLAAVAIAACSSPAASPSVAVLSAAPATASPTTSPDESSPSTGSAAVMVATNAKYGQILVDHEGRTLYLFTPDEAGTPTCYEGCAAAWPPLVVTGEVTVGPGLDDSDFSTATRTDGGDQVKVGNWPLYYFAGDAAAGDTNGQGVGTKWYVVDATGAMIK